MHDHPKPPTNDPLAEAITALTEFLRVNLSAATKRDLMATEGRLMKALGERVDPAAVKTLSRASDALESSVESNTPKLSGQ